MKLYLASVVVCLSCLTFVSPGVASDVSYYGVIKSTQFEQTSDAAPVELTTNAYAFHAFAVASTNNVLTNATVSPPLHVLAPDDTNYISLRWMEQFNSQSALEAAYPNSSGFSPVNYTVTMYTAEDGVKSGGVSFYLIPFVMQISQPTTPHLTNYTAAQAVDTTRDFEIGWSSLGDNTLAIVQLTILDVASNLVYMTPAPFQPGALSGASFSATIPAYTLPAGTNLVGHLTIANPGLPNTNSYAGATGISALARDTQFSIITRPAPLPPRLTILPTGAPDFALLVEGEANRVYHVEAAPDFVTWTNLFTTNSQNGCFSFLDTNTAARIHTFYRARIGQ